MSTKIKPILFEVKDLGKYLKSSKKKFIWIFEIDRKQYTLELEFSVLSGKRRVFKDGILLCETIQVVGVPFQFPFTIDQNNLNIIQQGETFELRINNQVFSHLWQQERTKSEFIFDEISPQKNEENAEEIKGVFKENIDNEQTHDKKIKLSLHFNLSNTSKQSDTNQDTKFRIERSRTIDDYNINKFATFKDFSTPAAMTKPNQTFEGFPAFDFNNFGTSISEKPRSVSSFGLGKEYSFKQQPLDNMDLLNAFDGERKKQTFDNNDKANEIIKPNHQITNNDLLDLVFDPEPNSEPTNQNKLNISNNPSNNQGQEQDVKTSLNEKAILFDQAFGNVKSINQTGVGSGFNNLYSNNSTSFNNFQNLYAQKIVNPNQNYFNNYQQSFSAFPNVNLQNDINQGFKNYNSQFNGFNNDVQNSATGNNNQKANNSTQEPTTPFDFF